MQKFYFVLSQCLLNIYIYSIDCHTLLSTPQTDRYYEDDINPRIARVKLKSFKESPENHYSVLYGQLIIFVMKIGKYKHLKFDECITFSHKGTYKALLKSEGDKVATIFDHKLTLKNFVDYSE